MRDYNTRKLLKSQGKFTAQWMGQKKTSVPPKSKTVKNQTLEHEKKKAKSQGVKPSIPPKSKTVKNQTLVHEKKKAKSQGVRKCSLRRIETASYELFGVSVIETLRQYEIWNQKSLHKSSGNNDFSTLSNAMMDCTATINNVSPKNTMKSIFGIKMSSLFDSYTHTCSLEFEMMNAELQSHKSWKNLTKIFDVNQCNQLGYTLLHYACLFDRLCSVRNLLQEGADVHVCDMEGNQPLHIAAVYSSLDINKILLRHGSNGLTRNGQGRTALYNAIVHERLVVVLTMLDYLQPSLEHHPLCVALATPNEEILEGLLTNRRFDQFVCKGHQLPVLMIAVLNETYIDFPDQARNVVNFGAMQVLPDLRFTDTEVICRYIEGLTDEEVHQWTKDLPEYKNFQNKHGNTLLHYTSLYNSILLTKLLLEMQAAMIDDHQGNSPLHVSCMKGHVEVTKLLLETGANPNAKNEVRLCPLYYACYKGHFKVVEILLNHGVDPNGGTDEVTESLIEHLPLSISVDYLQEAVAPLLLHGAFVNFKNLHNGVILQKVINGIVKNSHISKIVRQEKASLCHLISAGAKFAKKVRNTDIISFERNICRNEDIDLVRYLVESGYRFKINHGVPKYLKEVQLEPYRLQCLAAQTIRTCVIPNAWVGVKKLQFPSQLKKHIVMNTSYVDV